MQQQLKKIEEYFQSLDAETREALQKLAVRKTYRKGEFLLKQDEQGRCSFDIEAGIVRKYYLNDGKEVTTGLLFPGDLAISFVAYTLQEPSKEYIQAVTEVVVAQLDYHGFQLLKNKYPKLVVLDLLLTEYHALWLESRLLELRTLNAEDRYKQLVRSHPHIVQQVSLTHIASYLGVTLETLSRIRARL